MKIFALATITALTLAGTAQARPIWDAGSPTGVVAASTPTPSAPATATTHDYGYAALAKPAFPGAPTIPAGLAQVANAMTANLSSPATQAALAKAGYKAKH